jgi:hypothetical protein
MNSLSDSAKPARADTVLVLDDDVLVRMPICYGRYAPPPLPPYRRLFGS